MHKNNPGSIKAAIVGAGLMGYWHARYAGRAGSRIAAVADTSFNSAATLSRQLAGSTAYDSIDAMLATVKPAVVHICTPLASHVPLAKKAIESGAHVLLEKPLAGTAEETQSLLELAARHGVVLCPVHQFAFQDGIFRARKVLRRMGEVLHASFTICSAGGADHESASIERILADILPHPLSVMRSLWPEIDLVDRNWNSFHPRNGELYLSALSGKTVTGIYISMNARPTRCEMDIYCERGRIHLNFFHGYAVVQKGRVSRFRKIIQPFGWSVRTFAAAGGNLVRRIVNREPAYPGLRKLVSEFYSAVNAGTSGPIPDGDTLAIAAARDRILAGIETGVAGV